MIWLTEQRFLKLLYFCRFIVPLFLICLFHDFLSICSILDFLFTNNLIEFLLLRFLFFDINHLLLRLSRLDFLHFTLYCLHLFNLLLGVSINQFIINRFGLHFLFLILLDFGLFFVEHFFTLLVLDPLVLFKWSLFEFKELQILIVFYELQHNRKQ